MGNLLLYGATVLIWGSTWLAITFQLGSVAPAVSVAYRFALAAVLLFAWAIWRALPLRFGARDHGFMALLGLTLFSVNYVLFYFASQSLTSGLVAVVFSTIIVMNIVNGWLFLHRRPSGRTVLGAAVGLVGIALVFWPELAAFDLARAGSLGLVLSVAATAVASLGNTISARNQANGLPVLQVNAFGMAYGAAFQVVFALVRGDSFGFDPAPSYWLSLLYLSVFGSIIAFGCYLRLLGRIGADRAAYAAVMFPVVALALSTLFEGFVWTPGTLAGVGLTVIGNVLVIARLPGPAPRRPVRRALDDAR